MKKQTILLLVFLFSAFLAEAQRLQITNFEERIHDQTAVTKPIRNINGNLCGLIRVQFANGDMVFLSQYIQKVEKSTNEYLVWMNPNATCFTIKVPGYFPFKVDFKKEFGLENGLKSGSTYVMVIEDPQYANKTNHESAEPMAPTNDPIPDVDKGIPLTTAKNTKILAVVIGNENYSKLPDVPYAENDAKMFREYCEKTLGVTKEHIKYLPNAGFVDIYDAVEWLKKGTDSYSGEASVIFYYAGHGLPDPTTGSQYLLPADVDGKNLNLTVSLQKLYDEFGQMPARSVAVFLDACFSGTNRDNHMVAANKGARLALVKSKKGDLSGKTIVFSATEEDQTAHPFADQKHGFFTYFLLCKLQESKGDATLGEIADYVTKNVKRAVFDKIQVSQTPSVSSSSNLGNDWRQMKLK